MSGILILLLFAFIAFATGTWKVFLVVIIGFFLLGGVATIAESNKGTPDEKLLRRIDNKLKDLKKKYSDDIDAKHLMDAARFDGVYYEDDLAIWAKNKGKNVETARRLYRRAQTEEHKKALAEYEKKKAALEAERSAVTKSIANAKLREDDKQVSKRNKERAEVTGYNKYLGEVTKQLDEAEKQREGLESAKKFFENQYVLDSNARAQKHDPYVWGGIADGIAGPGAGVATALSTMQENAEAEARAAQTRAGAADRYLQSMSYVHTMEGNLTPESKLQPLRQIVASIKSRFIDDEHPEKYLKMLKFGNHEIRRVTPGGSAYVDVPISVEGSPSVLGKAAIIDGSLRVTAYVDGKEFARGYLIARGQDKTNLEDVGFGSGKNRNTAITESVFLVPRSNSESFEKGTVFELKFSPNHLWAIQA